MSTLEPHIPVVGGCLGFLLLGSFVAFYLAPRVGKLCLELLYAVSQWAGITTLVFLRRDMGVSAVTVKGLFTGLLFLYFIGNMVGHNYHDLYRDKGATILGAQLHLTYLAFFLGMGVFRVIQARYVQATVRAANLGVPSRMASFLPTHSSAAPRNAFYQNVVRDPLAVIALGLLLALALRNWFGWYLVIAGCLLFYMLLYASRTSDSAEESAGIGNG